MIVIGDHSSSVSSSEDAEMLPSSLSLHVVLSSDVNLQGQLFLFSRNHRRTLRSLTSENNNFTFVCSIAIKSFTVRHCECSEFNSYRVPFK